MSRAAGTALLFAVPALSLAWFTPTAWSALALTGPTAHVSVAPHASAAAASNQLERWQETQTSLVDQARAESTSLNQALKKVRDLINGNTLSPFSYQLAQQTLALLFAERNAWDANWRQIGIPGADPLEVQSNLIDLQIKFIDANSALLTLQIQEVSSGSITAFTAPAF